MDNTETTDSITRIGTIIKRHRKNNGNEGSVNITPTEFEGFQEEERKAQHHNNLTPTQRTNKQKRRRQRVRKAVEILQHQPPNKRARKSKRNHVFKTTEACDENEKQMIREQKISAAMNTPTIRGRGAEAIPILANGRLNGITMCRNSIFMLVSDFTRTPHGAQTIEVGEGIQYSPAQDTRCSHAIFLYSMERECTEGCLYLDRFPSHGQHCGPFFDFFYVEARRQFVFFLNIEKRPVVYFYKKDEARSPADPFNQRWTKTEVHHFYQERDWQSPFIVHRIETGVYCVCSLNYQGAYVIYITAEHVLSTPKFGANYSHYVGEGPNYVTGRFTWRHPGKNGNVVSLIVASASGLASTWDYHCSTTLKVSKLVWRCTETKDWDDGGQTRLWNGKTIILSYPFRKSIVRKWAPATFSHPMTYSTLIGTRYRNMQTFMIGHKLYFHDHGARSDKKKSVLVGQGLMNDIHVCDLTEKGHKIWAPIPGRLNPFSPFLGYRLLQSVTQSDYLGGGHVFLVMHQKQFPVNVWFRMITGSLFAEKSIFKIISAFVGNYPCGRASALALLWQASAFRKEVGIRGGLIGDLVLLNDNVSALLENRIVTRDTELPPNLDFEMLFQESD